MCTVTQSNNAFFKNNSAKKLQQNLSPISKTKFDPKCHTYVDVVRHIRVDPLGMPQHIVQLDGVSFDQEGYIK
jgi:hypothetical protein